MASVRDERRMTMPRITVVVVREDVENAVKAVQGGYHAMASCPIACALCRALAVPLGQVAVASDVVEVYDWKEYALVEGVPTKKMLRAMERFDETGEMKPALFRIKLEPGA
jgi:hypothetical protein